MKKLNKILLLIKPKKLNYKLKMNPKKQNLLKITKYFQNFNKKNKYLFYYYFLMKIQPIAKFEENNKIGKNAQINLKHKESLENDE